MAVIKGAQRPGRRWRWSATCRSPGRATTPPAWPASRERARPRRARCTTRSSPWPERTLVFLWGDEFRQSESWLDSTDMKPVAGISSDMTGQSKDTDGAIALLERIYDPGALKVHRAGLTHALGRGPGEPRRDRSPTASRVIARCAHGRRARCSRAGPEDGRAPFEGGSDHDRVPRARHPGRRCSGTSRTSPTTRASTACSSSTADEMRRTGRGLARGRPGAVSAPARAGRPRPLRPVARTRAPLRIQKCEDVDDLDQARGGTRGALRDARAGCANLMPGHPSEKIPDPKTRRNERGDDALVPVSPVVTCVAPRPGCASCTRGRASCAPRA